MPRPQKKNNKRILIQKCYVKLTRCDEMKNKQNTEMKKQTHPTITEKIMAKKRGRPPVLKSKLKTTTTKTPPQRTRPAPSPSPSPSPSPPPKADRRRTRLNVSTGVSLSTNTESAPPRKPRKKSIEKPLILTSKRTPKPNRRYMNDDENVVTKVNTHKNRDNEDTSNFGDEDDNDANDDDGDYDQQVDHNENTKKDKNKNIILNKKKNTDDDYKIDDDEDDDDDDDDDNAAAADDDDDKNNNDDDDRHSENIALVKSLRVPKKIVNYTGKPPKSNASAIKSNASLQIALKNALANVSKKRKLNVQEEKQQQRRRSSEVDKVKRLKLNQESTLSENSLNNKSTNVLAKTGGIVTSTPLMTTKRFAPSQLNEHKKPAILGKRSSMPSPITKLPSSSAGTIKQPQPQPSPPPSPSPSPSPPPPPLPTKPSSSSKSVITRAAVLTLTTNTAAPNFKREVPVKTSAQFLNTLNKSTTIRNVQGKQAMTITKVTSKNDDDSKISLKPVNNTITRTTTTLNLKDFEQMPTFTIVNINDIINQKEDAVIQESVAHKKNLPPPRIQAVDNKKTVIAKKINNIILNNKEVLNNAAKHNNNNNNKIIELMDDTSDDDTLSTLDSVTLFGSSSKKPNKKEAQALKNKNNIPSKMGMANGQLKTTPPNRYVPLKPQRILNSTLCNNPTPLTKLVSKVISNSNNINTNNNNNNNNNKIINNNISNDNTKIVPVKQHLPLTNRTENNQQNKNSTNNSEYKFISSDRPRLLRKVTCYETWFILHVEDDKPQKPPTFICEMSLIRLGNRIKELNLPTSKWSYKIALQRKPFMLKSNKNNVIKIKDDDDDDDDDSEDDDDEDGSNGREEIYRGEVQDSALNSKTPEIYQPINIMFRREVQPNNYLNKGIVANQTTQLKFQYDRAVIFRNQTFFLNIDGKSIRLIGAPLCIKTLQDVQILLEIVNDINLNNPFVEYTNSLI